LGIPTVENLSHKKDDQKYKLLEDWGRLPRDQIGDLDEMNMKREGLVSLEPSTSALKAVREDVLVLPPTDTYNNEINIENCLFCVISEIPDFPFSLAVPPAHYLEELTTRGAGIDPSRWGPAVARVPATPEHPAGRRAWGAGEEERTREEARNLQVVRRRG
jgi:hypothetical protein